MADPRCLAWPDHDEIERIVDIRPAAVHDPDAGGDCRDPIRVRIEGAPGGADGRREREGRRLAKAVVNMMTYRPVAVREAVKPEPNDTAPDELMRPRRMRSFSSPLAAWYWPEERG